MKKSELNNNPVMKMMKKSLLDLPCPSSISTLWNMGFLLGMVLTMQLITGILVSMSYSSSAIEAFSSMINTMQDINNGWATRLIHMNGASLFFMLMYMHTGRGIYFKSPNSKEKTWITGLILMLLTMATAFLGYVLPWGQMSFWGATVITGVLSAIPILGNEMTTWIWGGPSISQPTLTRFFSLHYLLPMTIVMMMVIHLMMLHETGSSNPSNTKTNLDKIKFNPTFTVKDSLPMIIISMFMLMMLSNYPNILGDVENYNPANPLIAPIHIQPEWYFLFAYVILRSIPSKLGGVTALVMSILILIILVTKKSKSTKFSPTKKTKFWFFISTTMILTWIGMKTVESPFEEIGKMYTTLYFFSMVTM